MLKDNSSGRIWVESGTLHHELSSIRWQVPIAELKIIGEYTNDHGPYADDYFFVFLTSTYIYEASFYSKGSEQAIGALSGILGVQLSCELTNSTELKSRVMWPPDLDGEPLFRFVPKMRNGYWWAHLKDILLPLAEYHFTQRVKQKVGYL